MDLSQGVIIVYIPIFLILAIVARILIIGVLLLLFYFVFIIAWHYFPFYVSPMVIFCITIHR